MALGTRLRDPLIALPIRESSTLNNYWMRFLVTSRIIKGEVSVISRSRRLRPDNTSRDFDNSGYHEKPNSIIVLLNIEAPFTRVRTNICTDKILHGSTKRSHGAGGTGRIFERLSVQVWDLKEKKKKKKKKKKNRSTFWPAGFWFCTDSCKHPSRATFLLR